MEETLAAATMGTEVTRHRKTTLLRTDREVAGATLGETGTPGGQPSHPVEGGRLVTQAEAFERKLIE